MAVTYYALLTTIGAGKLANATALGTTLKITQLALGDGGGNVPTPDASRTQLVNEVRRAPLNRLSIDPANSAQIIAEQVIPEDVGGWWIREMGLYDEAGALIAYANCAPSYKPQLAEGSGRTQTVRIVLIVSNAASVELKIDPSVVLATREYVDSAIVSAMNRLDCKQSVRVATTASITLSGLQTLDGIALLAGDRVLVKNQSNAADNGIYVAATSAWKRSADADENSEVTPGLTVVVESGTSQADSIWQLVTDGAIVLGTTALSFQNITNGLARLQSPAFTGVPTAPTPAAASSDASVATTAFVRAAMALFGIGSTTYQLNWPNASLDDCTNVATGIYRSIATTTGIPAGYSPTLTVQFWIRSGEQAGVFQAIQCVQDTNSGRSGWRSCTGSATATAPIWSAWKDIAVTDSPAFTGVPTAPTAAAGVNSTQLATTAFVQAAIAPLAPRSSPVLTGNPTAPTPALFSANNSVATTAFVRANGASFSDVVVVSSNTSLNANHANKLMVFQMVASDASIQLPAGSSCVAGTVLRFMNISNYTANMSVSAGDRFNGDGTTIKVGPGDSLELTKSVVSDVWLASGGTSSQSQSRGVFKSLLGGSGYQVLPSGLILQWGGAVTAANGNAAVTLPLEFPNAHFITLTAAQTATPTNAIVGVSDLTKKVVCSPHLSTGTHANFAACLRRRNSLGDR
ncbi:hypothetical protein HNP46_006256 [Pseudomonas nitritireducens]|uniref:Phage tail protein n=1 Tax=Pseudomonas nitroreducens TaxID=46680 RepID=A0A7W7KQY3_PSENT|nr:hypothetical protein [Pseudomonas nitritireducens]